jgi:RNA polymerase sigma factor (sigma-70 family)
VFRRVQWLAKSPAVAQCMPPFDSEFACWFAEEVQPHQPALTAWLGRRFPGLLDPQDVVQETFARLIRARQTGSIACPRAFLFVTARNLVLNRLRHERYEVTRGASEADSSTLIDEGIPIPESIARAEDLRLLREAIQALPERCRQVVTLRKIYGLSQREVAARLGISEHTVEVQAAIGLRKCVEYFRRHGYGRGRPEGGLRA